MENIIAAEECLEGACVDYERDLKAKRAKLDHKEKTLAERLNVLEKKKLDTLQANGNDDTSDDDIVEINAGGKVIAARRSALTQLKGTRMEALFAGRWDKTLQRDSNGRIFLDVNPKCFRAIVDHLNEMAISSQDDKIDPPSVGDEHKHILAHQMELLGLLGSIQMIDSCIIKDETQYTEIYDWLEEDGSNGEFNLLYRSSRDGRDDSNFHSKCDNQGSTLTIIETMDGHVFGGYSNTPWASDGDFQTANRAYLFVLSGRDVSYPQKLKLKDANDNHAVQHNAMYGPIFGRGQDFYVDRSQVYLDFGNSYEANPSCEFSSRQALRYFTIKEMEVFEIVGSSSHASVIATKAQSAQRDTSVLEPVSTFAENINKTINAKKEILLEVESNILHLEDSFADESKFIATFASGDTKDVVVLNVSGTIMATKRSTLQTLEESVLAQQFDDSKWTEQGCSPLRVKEWTPDDVGAWAQNIEGIQEDVGRVLKENRINGCELLALERQDLMMIGIERMGTLRLILNEIRSLKQASQGAVTFIEHSPYCFGKILDYLRLKRLHSQGFADEPALPVVCDSQKNRFEKVARYFFPGNYASLLG